MKSNRILPIAALGFIATFAPVTASVAAEQKTDVDCRVGSFLLGDGGIVDIGLSTPPNLRWRRPDGTSGALAGDATSMTSTLGWTGKSDGHLFRFDCAHDRI